MTTTDERVVLPSSIKPTHYVSILSHIPGFSMAHSVCTTHQCVSSTRERRGFKVFLGCPGLVVPIRLFLTPFLPLSLSFPLPPSPSPQELVLSPDLETLTFSCSEKIIIDVLAATNTITMHSKEVRTVGPQVCQRLNVLCKEGRKEGGGRRRRSVCMRVP